MVAAQRRYVQMSEMDRRLSGNRAAQHRATYGTSDNHPVEWGQAGRNARDQRALVARRCPLPRPQFLPKDEESASARPIQVRPPTHVRALSQATQPQNSYYSP